jgi:beta-glucosidase
MPARSFPPGFMLGCATSAHQVEGGIDNDWSAWAAEDPSQIADRSDATVACDHYNRYRDDFAQLAATHQNAHRFSVEWARIEPRPGCFDPAALAHYSNVVRACRDSGMDPIVTLHHFTLPRWFSDAGGVLRADAPALFARYVSACAEAFGEQVEWWITINEPAVLAVVAHLQGRWPPQERSLPKALGVLRALLLMHAAGAHALHATASRSGRTARVSVAHQERPLRPRRQRSLLDYAVAALPNYIFNRWFLQSCRAGRVLPPLGSGSQVPWLRDSLDYIGVNYYCEDTVSFDAGSPATLFTKQQPGQDLPLSSIGWAIDPGGLRRAITNLWQEFRLPIVITENGVADEHDELRTAYLVDHLNAVLDAIEAGADVRGYTHWTAWDNWEWSEGYTKRFGLYAVDLGTQRRVAKPSAAVYAEICRSRTLERDPEAYHRGAGAR